MLTVCVYEKWHLHELEIKHKCLTSIEARFFVLFCGWVKNILPFSCVYDIYGVYL